MLFFKHFSKHLCFELISCKVIFSVGNGQHCDNGLKWKNDGFMDAVQYPKKAMRNVFIEPGSGMRG